MTNTLFSPAFDKMNLQLHDLKTGILFGSVLTTLSVVMLFQTWEKNPFLLEQQKFLWEKSSDQRCHLKGPCFWKSWLTRSRQRLKLPLKIYALPKKASSWYTKEELMIEMFLKNIHNFKRPYVLVKTTLIQAFYLVTSAFR